jgi:hypothetical protein
MIVSRQRSILAMQDAILRTKLSELNRLYGVYYEATSGGTPDPEQAATAWIDYEGYARRYNSERGLEVALEPRRGA